MAKIEIIMPKMGESVAEATIIKWLKKEGDKVEAEEAILEIATDKVDSEIPSPESGILSNRLFKENDVVKVGEVIAVLETEGPGNGSERPSTAETAEEVVVSEEESKNENLNGSIAQNDSREIPDSDERIPRYSEGRFYSPLVRSIARKEGISIDELNRIKGSGLKERLTKIDLLNYLTTKEGVGDEQEAVPEEMNKLPERIQTGRSIPLMDGDEIVEMDRMRKLISEHMVMSKHTSPHVTSMVEVDVTNIVSWREKVKADFEKREGEKITFTPIFIELIAKAIREMPGVNVSVDGSRIIRRKHINIGLATALPSGNLIVPVIRDADQKNLLGLVKTINDLAGRARTQKLNPDEISNGTFTVTNVGTFGNVMGTPIINQPQVAIMALGAIRKKPAVIETQYGDSIGIRHMMFLSMSYDHRVVDGALGGSFIRRVGDLFEAFNNEMEI